jgi:hypothetical protein
MKALTVIIGGLAFRPISLDLKAPDGASLLH